MHSFTTQRLLIRPLAEQDKDFFCQQYTDAKVMRNISKPMSFPDAEKAFHRAIRANSRTKKTVLTWAIVCIDSDEIIGTQALSWQKPTLATKPSEIEIEQAEIGMMLATKIQGQGFGKEALSALMEYGFKYSGLDRINTFHENNHFGSKGLVRSIGFSFEPSLQDKNSSITYLYFDKDKWHKKIIIKVLAKHITKEKTEHADEA